MCSRHPCQAPSSSYYPRKAGRKKEGHHVELISNVQIHVKRLDNERARKERASSAVVVIVIRLEIDN